MGGSAPKKSFKQASNPHGNTHIHRQANTNEWTWPRPRVLGVEVGIGEGLHEVGRVIYVDSYCEPRV